MQRKVWVIGLLSVLLLAACSGESTTKKISIHMEEAVQLETDFAAQQQPINQHEEKEQEIYQEISQLGMGEIDQIITLADEALQSIEERKEFLNAEKKSIDAGKEEFDKIESLIPDIEDESMQETATEMYDTMEEKYQAYITLHEAYAESLKNDQKLYELLKQEEVEETVVSEQIDKVNAQYQKVIEANNIFTEKTNAFNDIKKTFYEASELKITYEES